MFRRISTMLAISLILVVGQLLPAAAVGADMDWTTKKELNLEASPLAVAASLDGQWLYILAPGKVLLYSLADDKVVNQVPVDEKFDGLTISIKDNNLILSSSSQKTLKIIELQIVHDIPISGLPYLGPEDAPVVITVFNDYQCPYCSRLVKLLEQVTEEYPQQVKLVYKNFPLAMHKSARKAATAALAADAQGKFWEFHRKLFENQRALSDEKINEISQELDLDMEKFSKDMESPAIQEQIAGDIKDGQQAGVRGTPTIFVNGKIVTRRTLDGFEEMIEAELEKKGKVL